MLESIRPTIAENEPAGTEVMAFRLAAGTEQSHEQYTYTLLDDAGGAFAVSGDRLVTAVELNYEEGASYSVTAQVTDDGSPPLSAQRVFVIRVLDRNDPPSLTLLRTVAGRHPNPGKIYAGLPAGTALFDITVRDEDLTQESTITYTGASAGQVATEFGRVVLTSYLDEQATPVLEFTATATDPGGLTSDVSVSLEVVKLAVRNGTEQNVTTTTLPPDFQSSSGIADPVTIGAAAGGVGVIAVILIAYCIVLRRRRNRADLQRMLDLKKNPVSPFGFAKNRWYSVENLSDAKTSQSIEETLDEGRPMVQLSSKKLDMGDEDSAPTVGGTQETDIDVLELGADDGTDELVFMEEEDDNDNNNASDGTRGGGSVSSGGDDESFVFMRTNSKKRSYAEGERKNSSANDAIAAMLSQR